MSSVPHLQYKLQGTWRLQSFYQVRFRTRHIAGHRGEDRPVKPQLGYQVQYQVEEFPLEIYSHNITIGRYETPTLHAAIELLSGKPGK